MKLSSFNKAILGISLVFVAAYSNAQQVVRFQDYPGTGNLMVRVAIDQGFCAASGIRCELRTIPAAPLGMQTLLSGGIDIYFGPTEVVAAALARSAPVKVVAGGVVDPNFFMVAGANVVLPNEAKGYPEIIRDLRGKRVGVTQRGSGPEFQVVDMLSEVGLTANDVTFVAVGAPDTAFPAIARGQIDVLMSFSPVDGMCQVTNACRMLIDPRKGQGPASILATRGGAGMMAARADWVTNNPQLVSSVRSALKMAEEFAQKEENFPKLLSILTASFGLQIPRADEVAEITLRNSMSSLRAGVMPISAQAVADNMLRNNLLPSRVDMSAAMAP